MTPVRFPSMSGGSGGPSVPGTPFGLPGDAAQFHIPGSPALATLYRTLAYQPPSVSLATSSSGVGGSSNGMGAMERKDATPVVNGNGNYYNNEHSERDFIYRHDFDTYGVLYWLGTDRGTRDTYSNPALTGSSSIPSGYLYMYRTND
jgi:hypothetical protein